MISHHGVLSVGFLDRNQPELQQFMQTHPDATELEDLELGRYIARCALELAICLVGVNQFATEQTKPLAGNFRDGDAGSIVVPLRGTPALRMFTILLSWTIMVKEVNSRISQNVQQMGDNQYNVGLAFWSVGGKFWDTLYLRAWYAGFYGYIEPALCCKVRESQWPSSRGGPPADEARRRPWRRSSMSGWTSVSLRRDMMGRINTFVREDDKVTPPQFIEAWCEIGLVIENILRKTGTDPADVIELYDRVFGYIFKVIGKGTK